jgi:hypothetical protein
MPRLKDTQVASWRGLGTSAFRRVLGSLEKDRELPCVLPGLPRPPASRMLLRLRISALRTWIFPRDGIEVYKPLGHSEMFDERKTVMTTT